MSQRLLIVALFVVLLSSLVSTGLTWFLIDQARQANLAMLDQSRTANQAIVEQNQKVNEALLAKFSAFRGDGSAGKSMEWNPLLVRIFVDKLGGVPAVGCDVALSGRVLDTTKDMRLDRTTNAEGIADFGLVRPGEHFVRVNTPWGETTSNDLAITVQPGQTNTVEIVCPPALVETDVEIAVDWPDEAAGGDRWLVCDFYHVPRSFGGQIWTQSANAGRQYIAMDASGKLFNFDVKAFKHKGNINPSAFFNPGYKALVAENPGIYRLENPSGPDVSCIWLPAQAPVARLRWPVGIYRVGNFASGREFEDQSDARPGDLRKLRFLGGIMESQVAGERGVVNYVEPGISRMRSLVLRRRDAGRQRIDFPEFEAVAGRLNQWRLSVPEPLINLLKETSVVDPAEASN